MRIVLVEDNGMLAQGVANALRDLGHAVDWIPNGLEADSGGAVRVVIRFEPDGARMVVEDAGRGVPPEARERIFERLGRGSMNVPDGCGPGRAIAREKMVRHGGWIRLADAPKGTRVEIDLPLATAA